MRRFARDLIKVQSVLKGGVLSCGVPHYMHIGNTSWSSHPVGTGAWGTHAGCSGCCFCCNKAFFTNPGFSLFCPYLYVKLWQTNLLTCK